MHVEQVGRTLLHFRFPCLQETHELTAEAAGASGKLISLQIFTARNFRLIWVLSGTLGRFRL